MEWQKIETAPKDGQFLVSGKKGRDWVFAAVSWDYEELVAYSAYNEPLSFDPSHWMQLPKAPE